MEWPQIKIAELCEILDNKRKPITKKNRVEGPYPYYGATGVLDYVESYLFDEDLVLLGEDGAKWGAGDNSAFPITGKTWVNNHAHVLKPDRNKILDSWLIYYLNSEDLSDFITGMTVPKLNQGKLKEIAVPTPSIPEQKRIVALLDTVFADLEQTRAKTEQNLKNARELFDSYLQQVFSQKGAGWVIKKVSEVADTCLGKMLDKKKNKGELKPYLRNLNVQWFNINTSDLLDMKFEDSEYERYAIKKGDLVICEGGYPGRGAIWEQDEDIFFQKALHRIRSHDPIFNHWILYYLYFGDRNGTLKNSFTGAGIQHFTGKALKQLTLPIPDKIEAEKFINKMDALLKQVQLLEIIYQKKLNTIDELKKSILQKAFNGELTHD